MSGGDFAFIVEGESADFFSLLASAIATSLSVLWVGNNNVQLVFVVAETSAMVVAISLSCVSFRKGLSWRRQRTSMRSFIMSGLDSPFATNVVMEQSVASGVALRQN